MCKRYIGLGQRRSRRLPAPARDVTVKVTKPPKPTSMATKLAKDRTASFSVVASPPEAQCRSRYAMPCRSQRCMMGHWNDAASRPVAGALEM